LAPGKFQHTNKPLYFRALLFREPALGYGGFFMELAMIATKVSWKEKEAAIRSLESGGMVDPLSLIEAARNEDHPCHGDFTWDVEQAASERWRDQARE
jgi:hypothetical protein